MSEPEKKEQRRPCSPEMLTPSMLLNDVSHLIRNKMRREGEASGMRQGYRRIMFHLAHGDDGGTQQDLVRRTKLSAPTISVALNRMEAEGLVKRQSDQRRDHDGKLCLHGAPNVCALVYELCRRHCHDADAGRQLCTGAGLCAAD